MSAGPALVVAMVYVTARLLYQRAVSSTWSINAETLAHFVIVPPVQIGVLAIVLRFGWTKRLWHVGNGRSS